MQRFHQILFVVSLLVLCWFVMMAIHELGHVIGAIVTGGYVQRVVLYPLSISRTDVSPNPSPLIVVWLGPIIGSLIPSLACLLFPKKWTFERNIAIFIAGFCLIANGAYIALGSLDQVGDCRVMLENGSEIWQLLAFGALAIPLGLMAWHRLGSPRKFLADPSQIQPSIAYGTFLVLACLLTVEFLFSSV